MEIGQLYRDKDVHHVVFRIMEIKPDGWIKVNFNHKRLTPVAFNYHKDYIEKYYEVVNE